MNESMKDFTTDLAWEQWGRRDPYFGVITDPKFRRTGMTADDRQEFFDSGQQHADYVLHTIRRYIDPTFAPKAILDFGCGVGRLLVPFASLARDVVGLDVSPAMLSEARRNCEQRGLDSIRLFVSNDELTTLTDTFDLIHSFIVFQHIPIQRGREIFGRLLRHLRPGGVAAIQLTYSKKLFAASFGVAPVEPVTSGRKLRAPTPDADPEIQMNAYNLNEILFLMQTFQVRSFHVDFTDHGGEFGVFLFFQSPGTPY
jgi:2-polyprenyl-3-methyl-5-hydroxy-6-metoxy-1,4-benzoquinol methylase